MPASDETHDREKPDRPFRVLVVEDHPMIRAGMRSVLERTEDLAVCAEAATAAEAVEAYRRERPDVVCMDLILGAEDGLGLIRRLRAVDPGARIMVLSVREEGAFAERCLQAGALGYAMKTEETGALLDGLRRVAVGEVRVSAQIALRVLTGVGRHQGLKGELEKLSAREQSVFRLIGAGLSTREIASRLRIGVKTVETYRGNIKNKLGLEHGNALAQRAAVWARLSAD